MLTLCNGNLPSQLVPHQCMLEAPHNDGGVGRVRQTRINPGPREKCARPVGVERKCMARAEGTAGIGAVGGRGLAGSLGAIGLGGKDSSPQGVGFRAEVVSTDQP